MSRVGGRGGKGRQLSPFPPAHRLIELHCAHREYVLLFFPPFLFLRVPRFPEKNFAPGLTKSDDSQLCGPISIPALALPFVAATRIQSEADTRATARAGISAFARQFGFMVR